MNLIIVFCLASFLVLTNKKVLMQTAILIVTLLFALRTNVPDISNYEDIYVNPLEYGDGIEYGFLVFCDFFRNILGISFRPFLFIITLLLFEIWLFLSVKLLDTYRVGLAFVIFLSYWGIFFYGIVFRAAISITLCYIALYILLKYNNKWKYLYVVLFILLATNLQVGSILFFFSFLLNRRLSSLFLYIVISLSIIFLFASSLLPIESYITAFSLLIESARIYHYSEHIDDSQGISIITWVYILSSFLLVYYRRFISADLFVNRVYNLFLNMFVFGTLLSSILCNVDSASRFPAQWLFFDFIVFFILLTKNNSVYIRKMQYPFASLIALVKIYALLHYFPLLLNF